MFSDNKKGKGPDLTNQQNRISQGTTLKGDVTSEGGFRIDGVIHGNITSPNKIVIGKTGVVIGTLICNDADVEGKIEGKLEIKNLLSIKTAAHIEGEVITGKLAVEPGATFNASCVMKGSVKSLSNGKGKEERSA
ncbi:polymer-forming cytoskeletal protein [uncultured Dokdonia sp.]|jgi:cytoskeletal protein CcmA (bactofilin family)|uniref:bactofilin family protein n=1 Tax=unclassified Dokdonia TaxID=2615033 RepID=UPI0026271688|nr:polymer-forming cytoskeletal protein [uncultured Dokdonia sp.]|tara:strand:- start:126829 stop:127233 length:405 start_codon:yes stop_codon:yes gene_type:complete